MTRMSLTWAAFFILSMSIATDAEEIDGKWTAKRVAIFEGFQTPECVAVDPRSGMPYVSNIVADKSATGSEQYWSIDNNGFISRLEPGGQLDVLLWRESSPKIPLNSPKGICFLGGRLHCADVSHMVSFDLNQNQDSSVTSIPGAKQLNDAVTDGKAIYLSDTATGKVHRLALGSHSTIKGPKGVNGITFCGRRMYAVSWDCHDIYELDTSGQADAEAFGLESHFAALDGIEILDDGTFLVSDFMGNKVSTISKDRKMVRTLLEIKTPADIGFDRCRLLLYVPLFMEDRIEVFKLERK